MNPGCVWKGFPPGAACRTSLSAGGRSRTFQGRSCVASRANKWSASWPQAENQGVGHFILCARACIGRASGDCWHPHCVYSQLDTPPVTPGSEESCEPAGRRSMAGTKNIPCLNLYATAKLFVWDKQLRACTAVRPSRTWSTRTSLLIREGASTAFVAFQRAPDERRFLFFSVVVLFTLTFPLPDYGCTVVELSVGFYPRRACCSDDTCHHCSAAACRAVSSLLIFASVQASRCDLLITVCWVHVKHNFMMHFNLSQ